MYHPAWKKAKLNLTAIPGVRRSIALSRDSSNRYLLQVDNANPWTEAYDEQTGAVYW